MIEQIPSSLSLEPLSKQMMIRKVFDVIGYGGIYRSLTDKIYINLHDLAKFHPDDLMNKIVLTISHEYMHKLLHHTEGNITSHKFDNIDKVRKPVWRQKDE